MKKTISAIFLLLTLQTNEVFSASYPKVVELYFEGNVISPTVISPPPAINSTEKQNEILQIIEMQKGIKPEDIDVANFEYGIASEKFVTAVDPNLTRDKYPDLYNLLMKVRLTTQETKDRMKDHWASKHPYQVSSEVKLFIKEDKFNSYPSGHASKCYALARVMGMLVPEEQQQFLAKADSMSQMRVLVGEHFPSDIQAGQKLANIIVDKLLTIPDFKRDFKKAEKELRNYHPTKKDIVSK